MSESYYIRVRGEVKGPIARSELVSQIRKKRIGRHHEVSDDAINWVRAGDVPELFEPVVAVRAQDELSSEQSPLSVGRQGISRRKDEEATEDGLLSPDTEWYYAKGRNRLGPVSETDLRMMLATGRISGGDQVWNQSLEDWLPVGQLPQFASLAPLQSSAPIANSESSANTVDGPILASSLFSLQFACISLLCAPLVAMLTAIIVDSPGFSRSNAGAGMMSMLMVAGVFGALPVFSAIAGILTGHHSLKIHARSPGQYQGSGYALTALIVCYTVLVITLVTMFVFLIVIGVKSA